MADLKLMEIAARINAHLKRFEADPTINRVPAGRTIHPYYCAGAARTGRYVHVRYVSFQGHSSLTKDEALAYLEWLDAGNIGSHHKMNR